MSLVGTDYAASEGTQPPLKAGNDRLPPLVFNLRGRDEGACPEVSDAASLRAANGGSSRSYLLTSSQPAPPVRTSPSPDDAEDSPASGPGCSSSSPGSPMSLFDQEDGSSLRTSPACSVPPVAEISPSWSARWATSGFTISPGECWTAVTSECPSGGDACSSLADVLLDVVPERFFLSPRAAAGILRRAAKRGRELPRALAEALADLAYARQLTAGGGKPGQGYPAARIGQTVRRLTPTECERLQGFTDGHTIPNPMDPATPRWATP